MTFIIWIFSKIKKNTDGKLTNLIIWLAIIVTAILFGIGHLPSAGTITVITPIIVARAIILNGVGGIIFGWLYWKKGLESAMISHFSADTVLHVIFPLAILLFI